jgi:hypothetical protein
VIIGNVKRVRTIQSLRHGERLPGGNRTAYRHGGPRRPQADVGSGEALSPQAMDAGDDAPRGNDRLGVRRATRTTAGRESTGGARCRKEGRKEPRGAASAKRGQRASSWRRWLSRRSLTAHEIPWLLRFSMNESGRVYLLVLLPRCFVCPNSVGEEHGHDAPHESVSQRVVI